MARAKKTTTSKREAVEKALVREERRLEKAVFRAKDRLEAHRHRMPPLPVDDYRLTGSNGKPLLLSKAFGKKDDLIVIHNMGTRCPMCTTWADGIDGVCHHLEDRAALLVTSPDPVPVQKAFAKERGWRFAMASAAGTTFFKDMGFEDDQGRPWPGISTFHKRANGKIERVANASFGPGDDFSCVFSMTSMLKGGRGEWWPSFRYAPRKR